MSDPASGDGRGDDERTMEEIMATIGKAVTEESRTGESADRSEGADDDVLELVDEVTSEDGSAPAVEEEALVSTTAAAASAEAFAGLARAVEQDEAGARRLSVSEGGETIEDMVRGMLKPMLHE